MTSPDHQIARLPLYTPDVALVVFVRGINVGGHRRFRPSLLANELSNYGVVNIGATGTFVVRKPGQKAEFRAELLRKLPFEAEVFFCNATDIFKLEADNPFSNEPSTPDVVRFVSILSKPSRLHPTIPITIPAEGEWFVRVLAVKDRFIFGVYRRHMKTIGYLGQIDRLFGAATTTRNWNTITAIIRTLKRAREKKLSLAAFENRPSH